jgi:hypothetical protein
MALLGFEDGCYLELIAAARPGARAPWWPEHIARDGGPCAWSIRSRDAAADAAAFRARGIPVRGPTTMRRARPDGRETEFSVAFLGEGEPGTLLPFLIQDHTPRTLRVEPSPSARRCGLLGVGGVLLGTRDLAAAVRLFRQAFAWPEPVAGESGAADAVEAHFPGTPVTLTSPRRGGTPLAERLSRFGDCPAAFFLRGRRRDLPGLDALGLRLVEETPA